jgi:hypothetical protein
MALPCGHALCSYPITSILGAQASDFLLFLQNIFNASGAVKNPEQAEAHRLFGKQYRAFRGIKTDTHVFRMGLP